jgi:hypothetical protein
MSSDGLENVGLNPRPGYRKWRSTDSYNGEVQSVVDIHDDGSLGLAVRASETADHGWNPSTDVHVMDAQTFPAYLVGLARAAADRLSLAGEYELSIGMLSPVNGYPIYIRTFAAGGRLRDRDDLAPIVEFHPVTILFDPREPELSSLEVVRALALDMMNQGGSTALGSTYLKNSPDRPQ